MHPAHYEGVYLSMAINRHIDIDIDMEAPGKRSRKFVHAEFMQSSWTEYSDVTELNIIISPCCSL